MSRTKQRKVLGRGLSNLIAEASEGSGTLASENLNYKEVPLESILPNPKQPRKYFAEEELEELAQTLESVGMIEPVVLRPLGPKEGRSKKGEYELIAGERRFRAAKIAGFKKIPAVFKQANELEALEMGIIENIQREGLNPVEEARSYEYWMEATQQKADVLAKKIGKNRSTVKNLTRILKLPPEVLELIEKKELSVGQARPLLSIGNRKILQNLALKICKEAWSSRRVEEEVARLVEEKEDSGGSFGGKASSSHRGAKAKDANITKLEKGLRAHLSARVELQHKKNGSGKITIYYGNSRDRERLFDSLLSSPS